KWDPDHLDAPDGGSDEQAEQIDVDGQHEEHAGEAEAREDVPLEPVVRRAAPVLLEHSGLLHRFPIVEGALEHDLAETFHDRAMGIALTVGKRMVFPMAS